MVLTLLSTHRAILDVNFSLIILELLPTDREPSNLGPIDLARPHSTNCLTDRNNQQLSLLFPIPSTDRFQGIDVASVMSH